MSEPSTFKAVIELWPSREAMAADVGAGNWAVIKWFSRNSIPADWWSAVLSTDKAREAGVDAELLARLASRREEARA